MLVSNVWGTAIGAKTMDAVARRVFSCITLDGDGRPYRHNGDIMSNGGHVNPDPAIRSGQSPENRVVDLPLKIGLLATVVISLMLATRLVTYWLDISAAWPTVTASFVAIVAGSVTLAGDGFRRSSVGLAPLLATSSAAIILAIVCTLVLLVDNRVVSGNAVMPPSVSKLAGQASAPFVIGIDPYADGACGTYVFEASESELQPIPRFSDGKAALIQWLAEHDAIQSLPFGRFTVAKLILNITGQTESPVTITDISFEALTRGAGNLTGMSISGRCGDATTGRFIEANLDADPPKIVASNTDPNAIWGSNIQNLAPVEYPYVVKAGDSEPFYIITETNYYVEYGIRIEWIYQSNAGTTVVYNHGKPFKVGARAPDAPPARQWGY